MEEITFGTLHPDGNVSNVVLLKQSDIQKCPHLIMAPDHYKADGSCLCFDKAEQARLLEERKARRETSLPPGSVNRATQDIEGLLCYECEEPIEKNDHFTKIILFSSPFDEKGHEEVFHVGNDDDCNDCFNKLGDTTWADFRYFQCDLCNRMICRQHPQNGYHVQFRERDDKTICLRCYEADLLKNGIPQEDFEEGTLAGMFFDDRKLIAAGWEKVEDNVAIKHSGEARNYCNRALSFIRRKKLVITDYESLGLGGGEGYVSMWTKQPSCKQNLMEVISMKFTVTEKAQRPAQMNGTCFYCDQPIGSEHKQECVLIKKRVRLLTTIEFETVFPAHWDKSQCETLEYEDILGELPAGAKIKVECLDETAPYLSE